MIVHLTQFDPWILAPIAFGILTIFGRKGKKEEKGEEEKTGTAPVAQEPLAPAPGPTSPPSIRAPPGNKEPEPFILSITPEETSLNKLLQSLLQDIPFNPPPEGESNSAPLTSTPDWVPPRATPPSRPMIVVPGDKGEKVLAPAVPEETTSARVSRSSEPEQRVPIEAAGPATGPPMPPQQKTVKVDEDKKPSKPEKPERQEVKQQDSGLPARSVQGFDYIFGLTQGTLKTPGLVMINGPSGSGKTSLSSNLAGAYLKTGSPCLLVTYDQSVASLRDKIQQTGWDAIQYETQFRLLIVDGFSSQSDSFSLETYYIEKPFDIDNVSETLTRDSQVFMGSNVQIILDSMTKLASTTPPKEFLRKFQDLVGKMKESGVTFIVTLDETKLPKEITGPLEDMAACVIDLQKDAENSGRLNVRKLKGSVSKSEPQSFEIEPGKGLLFA